MVHVRGALDLASSPVLDGCLADLLDAGIENLVVELSAVPFCDSSGLGVLIGAHRRLTTGGGHLAVQNPLPPVRHLLEISGLDRVFEVS